LVHAVLGFDPLVTHFYSAFVRPGKLITFPLPFYISVEMFAHHIKVDIRVRISVSVGYLGGYEGNISVDQDHEHDADLVGLFSIRR
jgi:hypothetical protein